MTGVLLSVMFCVLAVTGDSPVRPTASATYSADILELLGVVPGNRPYLDSLESAMRARTREGKVPEYILDRLVGDLTDGPAQGALASATEASAHVGPSRPALPGGARSWGGFVQEREWLHTHLADAAIRLRQRDPEKAKRYARACFVLAAEEELLTANTVPVVWTLKREGLPELAGLSDDTVGRIRQVLKRYEGGSSLIPVAKALDRTIAWLRENRPPVPEEQIEAIINTLRSALLESRRLPMNERVLAELTWRAMCLARAVQDVRLQESLVGMTRQVQPKLSSFGERLMEEAITQPGPRPETSGIGYFESPDAWKPQR